RVACRPTRAPRSDVAPGARHRSGLRDAAQGLSRKERARRAGGARHAGRRRGRGRRQALRGDPRRRAEPAHGRTHPAAPAGRQRLHRHRRAASSRRRRRPQPAGRPRLCGDARLLRRSDAAGKASVDRSADCPDILALSGTLTVGCSPTQTDSGAGARPIGVSTRRNSIVIPAVMPTYQRADLSFERGEGAYLFDGDGRRYLDFASGIAVTGLGHAHPHLVKALTEQAAKVWHLSNLYRLPGQERLAERLVAASFADSVFFCNSGAEAIECGLKMTRKFHDENGTPERYRVITVEGAFHGRTLATIAAGGQEKHLKGFDPI